MKDLKKIDMLHAIAWLDEIAKWQKFDYSSSSQSFRRYMKYYIRRLNRGYHLAYFGGRLRHPTNYAKFTLQTSKANHQLMKIDEFVTRICEENNADKLEKLKKYLLASKAANCRLELYNFSKLNKTENEQLNALATYDPDKMFSVCYHILFPMISTVYVGPRT